ncbi:MAG TPA: alkaline phosphatase family protein [Opitutus sp.]|nr:alkaline phosphatase family protein [Opitutus sp.]
MPKTKSSPQRAKSHHAPKTHKAPVSAPPASSGHAFAGPIEHVVVLMMENRSFDHIFGYRPGVAGLTGTESNLLDPSKPESASNPRFTVNNGAPWAVLAGQGPGHSLNAANVQLCNSKDGPSASDPATNNGFVANYQTELVYADKVQNPSNAVIHVAMQSFPPTALPSINALADNFCVCDHWYSEVPGPTQPNRLYLHAATSFGYALNVWTQQFSGPTIYNQVQAAGLTWATYQNDDNEVLEFTQVNTEKANFKPFSAFATDVKSGALPNYSFVIPQFVNATGQMANSQHAPQDARYGDNFVADVYEALRANPAVWAKSALVVIYDEHGGFYDHVVPPSKNIPNPDGLNSPPAGSPSYAPTFDFDRLGFRGPAVICSPWVKPGRVDSTPFQHTSVMATARKLFGITAGPLTKRDASANTFEYLFSELAAPRLDTPARLPRAPLPAPPPADSPAHPANQTLDQTQKDVLHRAFMLTRSSSKDSTDLDSLPETQGEAHDYIRRCYARHFGIKF